MLRITLLWRSDRRLHLEEPSAFKANAKVEEVLKKEKEKISTSTFRLDLESLSLLKVSANHTRCICCAAIRENDGRNGNVREHVVGSSITRELMVTIKYVLPKVLKSVTD